MCGRYVRNGDKQKISEVFCAEPDPAELPTPRADYHIAPTIYQPNHPGEQAIGREGVGACSLSLVPFFTKELSDIKGLLTINAPL